MAPKRGVGAPKGYKINLQDLEMIKGDVRWFYKVLYEHFCASRGSSLKSDKVMSLGSASVGAEDYKLDNEKNVGVWC